MADSTALSRVGFPPGRSFRAFPPPAPLLLAVLAINLACMPGMFWFGDPFAWREESRSLLSHGRLWIDAEFAGSFGEQGQYFVLNEADGRWYSKYGIVNSLMSVPPMLAQRVLTGAFPRPGQPPNLLIFNLYNIFLSLLVCAMLYHLTGAYTQRKTTRVVYVLAAMYATYLWYYQRAQGAEIYQLLFFLCFFACARRFLNGMVRDGGAFSWRSTAFALAAWVFALGLILTRILFALLLPVLFAAFIFALADLGREARRAALRHYGAVILAPPVITMVILGAINHIKFGSAFLTGYHQWHPEDHLLNGRLRDGVWGMLFSSPYSILLYFPILVFSLASLRAFFSKHRLDAILMYLTFAAFLLVLGKIPTWRGDWTYGPRYMLFILPVISLPFLLFLDRLWDHRRLWTARLACAATVVALGYSSFLQVQAGRLDFFAYYRARIPVEFCWNDRIATYFLDHHMGVICNDLIRHRGQLDDLPYFRELSNIASPDFMKWYRDKIERMVDAGNWYWG